MNLYYLCVFRVTLAVDPFLNQVKRKFSLTGQLDRWQAKDKNRLRSDWLENVAKLLLKIN
jgi:hypothetical protein